MSPSCADRLKIREPQPAAKFDACPGLYRNCFAHLVAVLLKLVGHSYKN